VRDRAATAAPGRYGAPRPESDPGACASSLAVVLAKLAADDELWRRLHGSFTEPELVELGYSIAIILGQQHWLATHGLVEHF
jgi:hypothetical protein